MKLPPRGTKRHKLLVLLHKHGEMSISGVCERMPAEERRPLYDALKALVYSDLVQCNRYAYDLAKPVREYLDGCEPVKDDFIPQIVPPRQVNVWTPEMKRYESTLNMNWRRR